MPHCTNQGERPCKSPHARRRCPKHIPMQTWPPLTASKQRPATPRKASNQLELEHVVHHCSQHRLPVGADSYLSGRKARTICRKTTMRSSKVLWKKASSKRKAKASYQDKDHDEGKLLTKRTTLGRGSCATCSKR